MFLFASAAAGGFIFSEVQERLNTCERRKEGHAPPQGGTSRPAVERLPAGAGRPDPGGRAGYPGRESKTWCRAGRAGVAEGIPGSAFWSRAARRPRTPSGSGLLLPAGNHRWGTGSPAPKRRRRVEGINQRRKLGAKRKACGRKQVGAPIISMPYLSTKYQLGMFEVTTEPLDPDGSIGESETGILVHQSSSQWTCITSYVLMFFENMDNIISFNSTK
ncbi:uncharacterized protein LOC141499302 [Macrotis lagotis]|uniref:uncharacterized protein LOC141499302 n=1 Tax=Macrotis lagotis TaxID=92651 RepID=UPI003D68D6E0